MSRPTPPVTRLRPADAEELLGMVEELTRRVDFLARAAEKQADRVDDHTLRLGAVERYGARLDEHAEALDAHEDRLNAVGETLAPKPKGPTLTEQVEQFVNAHPGLRFTAMVIGESMGLRDHAAYNRINSSLVTLATRKRIGVDIREGRNRVYYANPAPAAGAS